MTVQTLRSAGASSIFVNTVSGAPAKFYGSMGTPHNFTDPITGETITVISDATCVDFAGHIDTGHIEIDAIAPGQTDIGSKVGDIIVIRPVTEWANNLANVLGAEHKDNGKHSNVTADSVLLNTNQDLSNQSLSANAIINGGCVVAQRTAPNLSTTYQYGKVDRFAAKGAGTAVSAGTINQLTSSLLAATKGYDLQIAGATITGSGVVSLRYRIEAADARNFINAAASFGCRVYHNVGSSVNYTIYVRKANAADNFSSVTDIANSGAISVPTGVATAIKFENINAGSLGDVSTGIEIEIQIACGAITTKNFNFAEFVFNKGSKAAPYQSRSYEHELHACQRYYEKGYFFHVGYGLAGGNLGSSAYYKALKRAVPTVVQTNDSANNCSTTPGNVIFSTADGHLAFRTVSTTNSAQFSEFWAADAEL